MAAIRIESFHRPTFEGPPQPPIHLSDRLRTAQLEAQVPDLVPYFRRTGEQYVDVQWVPILIPSQPPSLKETIMRLTGAETESEIGRNGPPKTAITVDGNTVPELRLFDNVRHGRDSLELAMALLPQYPQVMRSTLEWLASQQGTKVDPQRDERPGKILHEDRGPNTKIFGAPSPNYGSIDATPDFINAMVAYCKQEGREFLKEKITHRDGRVFTMEDALFAAVGALQQHMSNPEGIVEFLRTNPKGLENQSWQDSPDSYFHRNGELANHDDGIASVEVQVKSLNAHLGLTELYRDYTGWTNHRVGQLARYIGDLWIEDDRGGFFALGTDRNEEGKLRRLEVLKSNSGYVLNSPLLDGDDPAVVRRREALIKTLFGPSMLNVAGIRTLSNGEVRFLPDAYHNGSVWPHDMAGIARGLDRQEYYGLANELWFRIYDIFKTTGLAPEFVRGDHNVRPTLNAWIVDVRTRDGQEKRLMQTPQPELGMAAGAMFEAENALQAVEDGRRPAFATDLAKRHFEERVLSSIAA